MIFTLCARPPDDFPNTAPAKGITVVLENAKATYNSKEYTLDRSNAKYEHYISTHKVDTKGLTHTLKDENGDVIDQTTGFDTWEKVQKFSLAVDAGEEIYMDRNGQRQSGMFSYALYTNDMRSSILLKDYRSGVPTTFVPHAGNSLYTIDPKNDVEGTFKLVVSSRDFANNLETTEIPVKLDTIPREPLILSTKKLPATAQSVRNTSSSLRTPPKPEYSTMSL